MVFNILGRKFVCCALVAAASVTVTAAAMILLLCAFINFKYLYMCGISCQVKIDHWRLIMCNSIMCNSKINLETAAVNVLGSNLFKTIFCVICGSLTIILTKSKTLSLLLLLSSKKREISHHVFFFFLSFFFRSFRLKQFL